MRIELSIILQILLESLPVSSSGNLALFGISLPRVINYLAHSATILIYTIFFRKKLITVLLHPVRCKKVIIHALFFGMAALIPTVIIYAALEFFKPYFPLHMGFLITTIVGFLTYYAPYEYKKMTRYSAFLIGTAQGIALLPGISRLGITYAIGRFLGLSWRTSFSFSCMIEAPLIMVAIVKGIFDIENIPVSCSWSIGFAGTFILSYLLLALVYKSAQYNYWWLFSFYTGLLTILAYAASI